MLLTEAQSLSFWQHCWPNEVRPYTQAKPSHALLRAQISTKCMHSSSLCRIMFLRQCNDLAGLARRDNFLLTVHSCININSHSDQSFKSLLPHPFTLDGDLPHLPSSQLLGLTLSCLPALDAKPPMPFLKPASPKASGQIQNLFMLENVSLTSYLCHCLLLRINIIRRSFHSLLSHSRSCKNNFFKVLFTESRISRYRQQ